MADVTPSSAAPIGDSPPLVSPSTSRRVSSFPTWVCEIDQSRLLLIGDGMELVDRSDFTTKRSVILDNASVVDLALAHLKGIWDAMSEEERSPPNPSPYCFSSFDVDVAVTSPFDQFVIRHTTQTSTSSHDDDDTREWSEEKVATFVKESLGVEHLGSVVGLDSDWVLLDCIVSLVAHNVGRSWIEKENS